MVEVHFLVIFALQSQSQGLEKNLEIQLNMDIKTGIKTFNS